MSNFCTFLLLSLFFSVLIAPSASKLRCLSEFEECTMPRDCCEELSCEGGDWATTTNFKCLSKRSIQLNALTISQKVDLISNFYLNHAPERKFTEEKIQSIVKRHQTEFAQLVTKLETKYGKSVTNIERTKQEC